MDEKAFVIINSAADERARPFIDFLIAREETLRDGGIEGFTVAPHSTVSLERLGEEVGDSYDIVITPHFDRNDFKAAASAFMKIEEEVRGTYGEMAAQAIILSTPSGIVPGIRARYVTLHS